MNNKTDEDNLLALPLTLPNGVVLQNRIAKSAMSETLGSPTNHVTRNLPYLYKRWAHSNIGLLITGNVMVDHRALGEPGNVVLEDKADLPLLREWAAAAGGSTQIWMQLNHPGKQSPKGLNHETVAPSTTPFSKDLQPFFNPPRTLRTEEITDIIQRFGRAAEIARDAGFHGVQVHGAHGYLVSQFLSPRHNQRGDEWGGSAENRRRFVLAVYAEIRRRVGVDFPVSIKLNSADFQRGGFTENESVKVVRALDEAGIDLIEISGGNYESPVMTTGVAERTRKASTIAREAYFLDFAERVRGDVKTPIMVTGGFRSHAGMNAALRSGALDVVGLGRLLALDPDAPAALLQGHDSTFKVQPIKTGIKPIDRRMMLEVVWYERQFRRIANGHDPYAHESVLRALLGTMWQRGLGAFRTRRLRV